MKRRVFNVYGDFTMIAASAIDIIDAMKRHPDAEIEIRERNPIIGNDDLILMYNENGKWWINDAIIIPKTLLKLAK